jgi:CheY-like chemotaxis protein
MNDNRLLIVDDDQDTCSNLSDILTDLGFAVDFAYRAQEALDLFKQHAYRLALLDYKLPCMTGVELFRRLRQIDGNVAGLLVTAFASRETEREALSAGLRHVVSKPVEMLKFLPLIEQALA